MARRKRSKRKPGKHMLVAIGMPFVDANVTVRQEHDKELRGIIKRLRYKVGDNTDAKDTTHYDWIGEELRKLGGYEIDKLPGGSYSNAAAAHSLLGGKTHMFSVVCNDKLGEMFLKSMKKAGVKTHVVRTDKGTTSMALVLNTSDGKNTTINFSQDHDKEEWKEVARKHERFLKKNKGSTVINHHEAEMHNKEIMDTSIIQMFIDNIHRSNTESVQHGSGRALLSMDGINSPAKVRDILERHNYAVFAPNEEEAIETLGITPRPTKKPKVGRTGRHVKTMFIKMGKEGSWVTIAKETPSGKRVVKKRRINAVKGKRVSDVGTGDAYIGAANHVLGLVWAKRGKITKKDVKFAARMGSKVATVCLGVPRARLTRKNAGKELAPIKKEINAWIAKR